jgi:outer membrane biosynthesis protein TonB
LVTLATGSVNTITLASPIPVQAGDLLGLRVELKAACMQFTQSASDVYGSASGVNPAAGSNVAFSSGNTVQLDVAATVDAPVVVTPTPTPLPTPTPTPTQKPTPTPTSTPSPTPIPSPSPAPGSGSTDKGHHGTTDNTADEAEQDTDRDTGAPLHPHLHHRNHKATFTSTHTERGEPTWSGRRDSD